MPTVCIAFNFIALKNIPLEKNLKILDLVADSVNLLIYWYRNHYSIRAQISQFKQYKSSLEGNSRGLGSSNFALNLFLKLGKERRKTSLARQEEMRNHAIIALQKSFTLAKELDLTTNQLYELF